MPKSIDLAISREIVHLLLEVSSKKEKQRLSILLLGQTLSTFLDILGIFVFGLLGTLVISGVNFKEPQGNLLRILDFLGLEQQSLQFQATAIGIIAVLLLIFRSVLSISIYSKTTRELSKLAALLSGKIVTQLMERDLGTLAKFKKQEWLSGLTKGIQSTLIRAPLGFMTLIVETALLIFISAFLFFIQPIMAMLILIIYGCSGFGIYKYTESSIKRLAESDLLFELSSNQRLIEMLEGFADLTVNGEVSPFVQEFSSDRKAQLLSQARLMIYPISIKYVFEAIIIFGSFLLSALSFVFFDAVEAASVISIFLIASSRIGPSILRLQQAVTMFRSSLPQIQLFFALNSYLPKLKPIEEGTKDKHYEEKAIVVRDVSIKYDGVTSALSVSSLSFQPGERVAFVGPSGGGKSTLVKVLAGLLQPESGMVKNGILSAYENRRVKKLSIGYVPQDITLFHGTIRDNLLLGRANIDDMELLNILKKVELFDLSPSELILNRKIDDFSSQLSGGQRQRLGIARALIKSPRILILDEFTSALDSNNESLIVELLDQLDAKTIVLAVSHRLSTIKRFTRVIYLREGKIIFDGKLEDMEKPLVDTL